jgi:hypothetical protein
MSPEQREINRRQRILEHADSGRRLFGLGEAVGFGRSRGEDLTRAEATKRRG